MLTITVKSYCEATDSFNVDIYDSMSDALMSERLPAVLMPYIAATTCSECEDLPFDLIGKHFEMTCFYLD